MICLKLLLTKDEHVIVNIVIPSGHLHETKRLHLFICADREDLELSDSFMFQVSRLKN